MKKICIYIPARNVEKTLGSVIDRIPNRMKREVKEILIIDNCSKDGTYRIAKEYKKRLKKLTIIRNKRDINYGGSQKKAYNYVIKKGYDIVVMLHGDGQYPPEKIPQMIKPILLNKVDMTLGSRIKGDPLKGGMPLWRFSGNRILTFFENIVLGLNLSEFHSGFRAYNCHSLYKVPFLLCSDDYNFDSDIIVQFKIKGLKIIDIEIPTYYGEESKSPTTKETFIYSMNIVITLYRYLLCKYNLKKIKKFSFKETP